MKRFSDAPTATGWPPVIAGCSDGSIAQ